MVLNIFSHHLSWNITAGKNFLLKHVKLINGINFSTASLPQRQDNTPKNKDEDTPANSNPLRHPDYFDVRSLFTVKDLFDARVHFGHKEGSLDDRMRPFIFGSRLGHLIFDLEQTAEFLRTALNVTAHVAYRDGVILFVSNYHQHCEVIERTAKECSEFAHTRFWRVDMFTNSLLKYKAQIRLPDLCIMLNTLNDVLHEHPLVMEAAKMTIPVVGVVDSNCNPNLITYPIPGNDDSLCAVEFYCDVLKRAILKGKEERRKALAE